MCAQKKGGINVGEKGGQVKTNKSARGKTWDEHGKKINEAVMQDTKISKGNVYNLFGIVRFLKEG